eukprot:CAMPEP_0179474346 /NCGR_PEP_ID=MMETSP0799-20121207/53825_1 /TAXON_ID=46947 /ORGANISM="Geminigera cryophila, Strain CCMP2564" /LENGTH=177 /DNA_ID=CAMNT_0021283363 /DNA_START=11 /DNA_END=542 /DNA_ORIENTATION=-
MELQGLGQHALDEVAGFVATSVQPDDCGRVLLARLNYRALEPRTAAHPLVLGALALCNLSCGVQVDRRRVLPPGLGCPRRDASLVPRVEIQLAKSALRDNMLLPLKPPAAPSPSTIASGASWFPPPRSLRRTGAWQTWHSELRVCVFDGCAQHSRSTKKNVRTTERLPPLIDGVAST